MTSEYRHSGVRALTLLHEQNLREFLEVWRQFRASGLALPSSKNPDYESAERLLRHVLGCARHYMVWMCQKLELPDPGIREAPEVDSIEQAASDYLEHLVECWRRPLVGLDERTCDRRVFESAWGVDYCIDAMLEHAVLHPVRHTFQLRQLMESRPGE